MDAVQLLGMALDLIDAVAGTVTIVSLWYTWIVPVKKDPGPTGSRLSGHAEIDRFLEEVRRGTGSGAHVHDEHKEHVNGALSRLRER